MSEELKRVYSDAIKLKNIILENKNIDLLLYLAKYNPKTTKEDIAKKFGKEALQGLKDLEDVKLVKEEENRLHLTNEGIFQVEGLLTISI